MVIFHFFKFIFFNAKEFFLLSEKMPKITIGRRKVYCPLMAIFFYQSLASQQLSEKYIYSVMQSDGNSLKMDTFQEAISSELMI